VHRRRDNSLTTTKKTSTTTKESSVIKTPAELTSDKALTDSAKKSATADAVIENLVSEANIERLYNPLCNLSAFVQFKSDKDRCEEFQKQCPRARSAILGKRKADMKKTKADVKAFLLKAMDEHSFTEKDLSVTIDMFEEIIVTGPKVNCDPVNSEPQIKSAIGKYENQIGAEKAGLLFGIIVSMISPEVQVQMGGQ
jgi:hypothetical protein